MERQCTICGEMFTSQRPSRSKGNCSKNSCKSKRYYYDNHANQKKRVLENYYRLKESDYGKVREINKRAQDKRRFGRKREAVLERDNYQCQNCSSKKNLVVHHKDHNGRGIKAPNNSIDNLVTLCASCHSSHHFGHRKLKV